MTKAREQAAAEFWAQHAETQRAEDAAAIEAILGGASLPALTGSEKQVAWATDIRHQALVRVARDAQAAGLDADPRARHAVVAAFGERTEARWWIDHRDTLAAIQIPAAIRRHYQGL